tara:strand:- start:36 stop:209 length:174 start_codon:yes stop_codon:yes gene_type:complete
MKITSAKYGLNNSCIITMIDGIEMLVPLDPNNRHYAEIQKQVKEGTLTIKDADKDAE